MNGKSIYEEFSRFFEHPTRETLRVLLKSNVGETDLLDFKESWPTNPALARHTLAIANSGGGAIIVGVRQEQDCSLVSVGVEKLRDKAEVI
jgi:predicted HTH transcriptional regulator